MYEMKNIMPSEGFFDLPREEINFKFW